MGLRDYQRKRQFDKTSEPKGKVGRKAHWSFVVQKHAASHLHYDFRLEMGGVLKSWAVPKGPSLDPAERRLAVEVEDHPIEYGKFEGTIPAGSYGAGDVIVWDRGTWKCDSNPDQAFRQGKLEFELKGEKLHGGWRLIRMPRKSGSKNNWLLIKRHDKFERSAKKYDITEELPESVKSGRVLGEKSGLRKKPRARKPKSSAAVESEQPDKAPLPKKIDMQLAMLRDEAPRGDNWLHEIKFDGYRILCRIENGRVKLLTRRQQDWTHRYESIAREASKLSVKSAILDGELVALLPSGVSSFQALQNAGKNGSAANLVYYVFDLLHLNGHDLRTLPLLQRKKLLADLLKTGRSQRIQLSEHFEDDGPKFFRQCCRLGLEGIISKRKDRPYYSGRNDEWIKSKCVSREELVIGGFTLSSAAQRGIGALLVGYSEEGQLTYAGRVGTGFSGQVLLELRKRLEAIRQDDSPFAAVPPKERGPSVRWVKPQLIAEVQFTGWTSDSVLRHPSFQGIREDKAAESIGRPESLPLPKKREAKMPRSLAVKSHPRVGRKSANSHSSKKGVRSKQQSPLIDAPRELPISLTHPERVLFPDSGITKVDLATYYARVAPLMLPHLVDRPLSLVRCPSGQGKVCFFQKHPSAETPPSLLRVPVPEKDGVEDYVAVQDLEGLLALVQISVLEIHPWGSRRDRLDQPDRIIFDLDPDASVPWSRVIDAALDVREMLAEIDLECFVKTTGGKGLHVVAPLNPRRAEWDQVKAFCRRIADSLVGKSPELYVATMSKAARKGKIFVDYLRNDRGSTSVAPYSTRAKPGAPVSTPLTWDELTPVIRSDDFHVGNVIQRLETMEQDPWRDIAKIKQSLPKR
ncbi:MAG: DNA ligase D [Planctomycetales bacterium]|nr:DNA ligase D [Planctomycetales bacterium]